MSKKDKILKDIENGILVYPYKWHEFFVYLKSKIPKNQKVPNPLILGGSGASSYEKNQRLIEHINIARKNNVLDVCLNFLIKLPEEEWEKSDGNLNSNEMSYGDIVAEDDKKLRSVNIKALPYLKKLKNINSKINDYEVLSREIKDKIIIRYYPNNIHLISDESEYNQCLIKLHEIFLEQKSLNNSRDDIEDFCYDILDLQIEYRKENSEKNSIGYSGKILQPTEEPNEDKKRQIYELYKQIYYSSFTNQKKINLVSSIFSWEPWSWRVVGISTNALREYKNNDFRNKSGFQRDHHIQNRNVTIKQMLDEIMQFDNWWDLFWKNDQTLIVTKKEHSNKNNSHISNIININYKLGYFKCNSLIGFAYAKKREGKFLQKLIKDNNL